MRPRQLRRSNSRWVRRLSTHTLSHSLSHLIEDVEAHSVSRDAHRVVHGRVLVADFTFRFVTVAVAVTVAVTIVPGDCGRIYNALSVRAGVVTAVAITVTVATVSVNVTGVAATTAVAVTAVILQGLANPYLRGPGP